VFPPVGKKQTCFSSENRSGSGDDGPHFELMDGRVANHFPLVVTKDLDSGPRSVWMENVAGKTLLIYTFKDLALDGIKFADEALPFLFSKTGWIDGFARCDHFHLPLPLPVQERAPSSMR